MDLEPASTKKRSKKKAKKIQEKKSNFVMMKKAPHLPVYFPHIFK